MCYANCSHDERKELATGGVTITRASIQMYVCMAFFVAIVRINLLCDKPTLDVNRGKYSISSLHALGYMFHGGSLVGYI